MGHGFVRKVSPLRPGGGEPGALPPGYWEELDATTRERFAEVMDSFPWKVAPWSLAEKGRLAVLLDILVHSNLDHLLHLIFRLIHVPRYRTTCAAPRSSANEARMTPRVATATSADVAAFDNSGNLRFRVIFNHHLKQLKLLMATSLDLKDAEGRRAAEIRPSVDKEEGFVLRPPPSQKFPKAEAKTRLQKVVAEALHDKVFDAAQAARWADLVAEKVREELNGTVSLEPSGPLEAELSELKLPRYKYVVQVSLGEQRGQGLTINSGVFWDSDTDATVGLLYHRDTFFCQVTVYAVYSY
uniref:Tctex1 domain-containing protein 4 n=1 Tax=Steinernema glaseri TaxID=37863 RepID=A0A1I7Z7P5_9BILA